MAYDPNAPGPTNPKTGISGRESVFDKRLQELRSTGQMAKPNRKALSFIKKPTAEFEIPSMDSKIAPVVCDEGTTEIERLAFIDPKSQLLNMRSILVKLATEWRRARRYKHPFSVMIIELDNAELLENLTPLAADSVFQSFCKMLNQNIREVDKIGSLGDNRLFLICPETTTGEAVTEAERLKYLVSHSRFTQVGHHLNLTASIGIASYPESADAPEDIFVAALDAIDAISETGGDKIHCAAPSDGDVGVEDFSPVIDASPDNLPKKPEMAPDHSFPTAAPPEVVVAPTVATTVVT